MEAQEIVRIEGQARPEDSVAVKWVELQRFYTILLAGSIITKGRWVGIPFRDLLRTRFPHVIIAAKEELNSGLEHSAEQLTMWLNKGLEGRQAEAGGAPSGGQSGMLAVLTLRHGPGEAQKREGSTVHQGRGRTNSQLEQSHQVRV